MPLFRRGLCVALLVVAACSSPPNRVQMSPEPARGPDLMMPKLAQALTWIRAEDQRRFLEAEALIKIADAVKAQVRTVQGPLVAPPVTASASSCGGDLPPCYVAQRESGGSYSAYNPGGCGGSGCYGKWQFSGAWAGKLGLPADLSQATPAQQDAAARALWNNGAGCSNWAAC